MTKVQQLIAELREAMGQIQTAVDLLERSMYGGHPYPDEVARERWLAPHKVHEAITNLEDVLAALRKGLE